MGIEKFLDFPGIDVLTSPDDHILDSSGDLAISLFVHDGKVPGVQPAVLVDRRRRSFRVFVIPFHDVITPCAQFPLNARRNRLSSGRVDDLHVNVRQSLPDSGHLALERIGRPRHGDPGGRFGLTIGDTHLRCPHFADDLLHHLDGARSTRHDPGAKMRRIVMPVLHFLEFGNEHGRHAMQSRAFGSFHCFQYINRMKRDNRSHGCGRHDTGEGPQHTSKAMEKGHRNAQRILRRQLHAFADTLGISDQVRVGQLNALRKTRCPRCILHVDDIVGIQRCLPAGELRIADAAGQLHHLIPGEHAWMFFLAEKNDVFQQGNPFTVQLTRFTSIQFRTDFLDHFQIFIPFPNAADHQQGGGIRLPQQIFQFKTSIIRVDSHQHRAHLAGGELSEYPFRNIVRPDGDMLALLDPKRHEGPGNFIACIPELTVGKVDTQFGINESPFATELLCNDIYQLADGGFPDNILRQIHKTGLLFSEKIEIDRKIIPRIPKRGNE